MSPSKIFIGVGCLLFGIIGLVGWIKGEKPPQPVEAPLVEEVSLALLSPPPQKVEPPPPPPPPVEKLSPPPSSVEPVIEVDRIAQLFTLDSSKLPIVETVSYTSRVPWLKGRPAWLSDYASHYSTSRHFIARSLNGAPDYFKQDIHPGDRFNVLSKDKNIQFHLLIDLSQCRLWFYAIDADAGERILLKTYRVGVGRIDPQKASGLLTPLGKYLLGERIAIYRPGTFGIFQDQKTEMIRVFGTRWIPFEKELEGCTEPARGFGLHGAPWGLDPATGQLVEERLKVGKYDSDGCIRLASEDIEEIFAIVITRPTVVELVKDVKLAKLPGVEVHPPVTGGAK